MNLNRWYRGVGTALSFIAFGIGGLFIGLVVAPLLSLCVRDTLRRQRLARTFIQYCFLTFIGLMKGLGVLDYHFSGQQRLQRPGLLVLANHPSLIDVIFLLAHIPQANCIVKGPLANNLFTRGPIRAAGYIINEEPEAILAAAKESLHAGDSLVLFPEGTRTTPQQPIRCRRGGANIALRTATPITPVLIRCTPDTLTKGEPWYHIPPTKVRIELHVLDDLPIKLDKQQPAGRQARHLTQYLSDFFNKELEHLHHERNLYPDA